MAVFISHNKADKAVAREIALFLAAENLSVWFDEWTISAGDSITEEISNGLKGCTHFLILWSANSSKSNWVRRELYSILSRAIQEGSPKIIPICIDETPLPDLIADLKYLHFDDGLERTRFELVKAITGNAATRNYIQAIVKKYHEVIRSEDPRDPFGLAVCPECGSDRLDQTSAVDHQRDDLWFFIKCKECGWEDGTQ